MPQEPDITLLKKGWLRYWLATRPGFLAASLVPVILGVAALAAQGAGISITLLLLTLVAIALVHMGVNVLNDFYDHENGTDTHNEQRIFPFTGGSRFIQNGVMSAPHTLLFGSVLLVVAMCMGIGLAMYSGMHLLWIGIAGLLLGWGYSAPPLRLNSRGFGEPAVALGFGTLTPLGAWFVQTGELSWYPIMVSVPIAILVMNILFINQFPDRKADEASGKHHWVVRLGAERAAPLYLLFVVIAMLWVLGLIGLGILPDAALVSLLPLGLAIKAGVQLRQYANEPQQLEMAIKMTIASMVTHGLLLSLMLWLV